MDIIDRIRRMNASGVLELSMVHSQKVLNDCAKGNKPESVITEQPPAARIVDLDRWKATRRRGPSIPSPATCQYEKFVDDVLDLLVDLRSPESCCDCRKEDAKICELYKTAVADIMDIVLQLESTPEATS